MSNNDSFKIPDSPAPKNPAPKKRGRPPKNQPSSPSTSPSPTRSSGDSPMSSPLSSPRVTRQSKDIFSSSEEESGNELNNAFIDLTSSPENKQAKADGQQVYNSPPNKATTSGKKSTRNDFLCHSDFDFQNLEPTPFHEHQVGAQCGLHALKNGLQINSNLDQAYMEKASDNLRKIEPSRLRTDGHYYDIKNGGWYSSFLLQDILRSFGLTIKTYKYLSASHPIRMKTNPAPCIIIVTLAGGDPGTQHYFALRRFFDGGALWNLNSFFLNGPIKESNDFVDNLIKTRGNEAIVVGVPENNYFARACNLSFKHRNKRLNILPEPFPFQLVNQPETPDPVTTQMDVDIASETEIIIGGTSDTEVDLEIEALMQDNPINYSKDFIQLMNGDERSIICSFQQLLTQYDLQLIDVPSDGHCFISTIIKYFAIIHQRVITVRQVEQDYLALHRNEETNTLIFEIYGAMKNASLQESSKDLQFEYTQRQLEQLLWSDFNRYFELRDFAFNDYLEIIIQKACKVFKIDILLIQCQSDDEVEDWNADAEYTLIRHLLNEPLHGNSFITLFRTSRNELSHYQLLIPASYDTKLTTRENIIRHIIDGKTEEYIDLKCDSETESLASIDSISQESNTSFSSNSSFNSSASSTSSKSKFKRKTLFTSGKKNKKAVAKNQKALEKRQGESNDQKEERRRIARERCAKKSEIEKDLLRVNAKYKMKVERTKLPESSKKVINLLKKIWHLHNLLKETPEQEATRLTKEKKNKMVQRNRESENKKLARLEIDAQRHLERYESMTVDEKMDFLNKVNSKREQESEEARKTRLEKDRIYQREKYSKRSEDKKQYDREYQKHYREFAKEREKNVKIDYEHCPGYFERDNFDESQYLEHYLGPMNQECEKCGSLNFEGEKVGDHFSICCQNGKIKLETPMWPRALSNLYEGKGLPHEVAAKAKERKPKFEVEPDKYDKPKMVKSSHDFGENIRTYNNSFAFASTSVKLPEPFRNMKNNAGNTFVKIQGEFLILKFLINLKYFKLSIRYFRPNLSPCFYAQRQRH
jgi:hypothetical protein